MESVDNQGTIATDTLETETQPDQAAAQQVAQDTPEATEPYQPFKAGKEKFKIDGSEVELTWDEARKYVSMGKAGYQRMQEAAELRKEYDSYKVQIQKAYKDLVELASKNPDGLLAALNPNYSPNAKTTQAASTGTTQEAESDPRDLELRELRNEVGALKSFYEKQEIEAQRAEINKELDDATTKYPGLKGNKFAREYIKSEYRKALQTPGMETVTIDDVAFHVSQELQSQRSQEVQETKQRIEQKRKQAPISVVAAGAEAAPKAMSLEDVKRLAGRA